MSKKVWYNINLEKEDGTKELLAKVKSKGLAYDTKDLFKEIYKVQKDVEITME